MSESERRQRSARVGRRVRRAGLEVLLGIAILLTTTGVGRGEERDAEPPSDPPLEGDTPRPLPDYDGRGPAEPDVADAFLWIPRILVSPFYVFTEYVIRRPFGAVFRFAEQHHIPQYLIRFFTFDSGRQAGLIPTFLFDFGFRPSGGLYFFWNDPSGRTGYRARAAIGGSDLWRASVGHYATLGPAHRFSANASFSTRPDFTFYGLGPRPSDSEARFAADEGEVSVGYAFRPWRLSLIETTVKLRHVHLDSMTDHATDPSVDEAAAEGLFARPPGADAEYRVLQSTVTATLDSRVPRLMRKPNTLDEAIEQSGSGVRVTGYVSYAGSIRPAEAEPELPRPSWARGGAAVGGFLDLTGTHRVLGLTVMAELAEPLSDDEIPFFELPSLGGSRPLRGMRSRRLVDYSATAATLAYRWPIWFFLDGTLHYSVGGVFGRHFEEFDAALLRSSFGVGVSSVGTPDLPFEILFALSTDSFEDGGGVDSFRFVLGTPDSL